MGKIAFVTAIVAFVPISSAELGYSQRGHAIDLKA
jgi:hypothetical protein